MLYTTLGNTGINVSRLGLGFMRLPLLPSKSKAPTPGSVDIKKTLEIVDYAISNGVNYIDTAYFYNAGLSELVLGHCIDELKARDKVTLATKLPPRTIKKEADLERVFEEQCQKLKTDYIDCYLIHNINRGTISNYNEFKAFEFLEKLKKEGRIGHIGFSFHDHFSFFEEVLEMFDWEFCQIQYNFIDEDFQAGMKGLKKAHAKGMGVITMESLKGGSLARPQPNDVEALWANDNPVPTPADRALRWLFNQPEVSIVLSGMNEVEQLKQNIISASHAPNSMTEEEISRFTKTREIYKARQKVPCTTCEYCMPCPAGVDIPANFTLYNDKYLFDTEAYAKLMYQNLLGAQKSSAEYCVSCGKCLKKCPQAINIPEELKKAHEDMRPSN